MWLWWWWWRRHAMAAAAAVGLVGGGGVVVRAIASAVRWLAVVATLWHVAAAVVRFAVLDVQVVCWWGLCWCWFCHFCC